MLKSILTAAAAALAISIIPGGAFAADEQMDHSKMGHENMDHDKMDHGAMSHEAKPGATEATGNGVINAVDAAKKVINLNHDPIPDLGWPAMTMDLPVTNKVDLATIKPGDKVTFHLKLGRDKAYRITEIKTAK